MTEGCFILRLRKFSSPTSKNDENLSNTNNLEKKFKELGFNIFGFEKIGEVYDKLLLNRPSSFYDDDRRVILSVLSEISSLYDLYESYKRI
ncbi:MAG: hypothetical protein PHQ66_01260 [Candidatus Nanoarchaeia archaeon]|nr:hypothetical protein [Candidatus Nanoarchaeia archaeon]MDD5357994.1 hypothetical protein [Candidatus Nanoarchaeia archaeon]MDD5588913.1 hypothetical protein [Candidatus Nanoarchaeia archaeon]